MVGIKFPDLPSTVTAVDVAEHPCIGRPNAGCTIGLFCVVLGVDEGKAIDALAPGHVVQCPIVIHIQIVAVAATELPHQQVRDIILVLEVEICRVICCAEGKTVLGHDEETVAVQGLPVKIDPGFDYTAAAVAIADHQIGDAGERSA